MKRALPWLVLTAVVLGWALSSGARVSAGGERGGNAPFGFGKSLAGGWLFEVDLGNGPFEGELLLAADGGVLSTNTVLLDADGTISHITTAVGSWERIGVETVAVTAVIRIVGSEGELKSYEKIVGELMLDGDELTGTGAGLIYLPGQDPLEDEPAFVLGPGPFIARRIVAETLPE
jgi:hypothetical protein